jgi:hypothetical protein
MGTRLAVLIDGDNMSATLAPAIFSHIAKLGAPTVKRVYGRPEAVAAWAGQATNELYECRPLVNVASAKNGTDIFMAIDAMDMLYAGVEAFCIVSNDRDFVPLAIRLRAAGKQVHAICKQGDNRYAKAFDSVLELAVRSDTIVDAFRRLTANRGYEMSLAVAGKVLRQHLPDVIPTTGKVPLRKALDQTGKFSFSGTGAAIRVRLIS